MWNWKATYFATPVSVSVGVCLLSPPIKSSDRTRQLEKGSLHICILHAPTFLGSLVTIQTEVVRGARRTLNMNSFTPCASVIPMQQESPGLAQKCHLDTCVWCGFMVIWLLIWWLYFDWSSALACHWATHKATTLVAKPVQACTYDKWGFLSLPPSSPYSL